MKDGEWGATFIECGADDGQWCFVSHSTRTTYIVSASACDKVFFVSFIALLYRMAVLTKSWNHIVLLIKHSVPIVHHHTLELGKLIQVIVARKIAQDSMGNLLYIP